jgi:hypothetical protein
VSTAPNPATPVDVFYCYSYRDEDLRNELEKNLSIMQRNGVITGWHDRRIGTGEEWKGQIDQHLNTARVILLFVSADFLASEYRYDMEMQRAMERRIATGKRDYWDYATRLELAVLAKDGPGAQEALANALAAVREPWEPETTAGNLRLIGEARERRQDAVPWAQEIEEELERVAK